MTRNLRNYKAVFLTFFYFFLQFFAILSAIQSPNFIPCSCRNSTLNPRLVSTIVDTEHLPYLKQVSLKEKSLPLSAHCLRSFDSAGGRKISQRQKSFSRTTISRTLAPNSMRPSTTC